MERLTDEMFLKILSYLSRRELMECGAVSQRWRNLSRDISLWQIANFSSCKITSLSCLVNFVQSVGVRSLNLQHSTIEDPLSWEAPSDPNQLEKINLANANISPRTLGIVLKIFTQLTCINLTKCNIGYIASEYIAANTRLKELDIRSCKGVSATFYKIVSSGCQSLEFLDLSHIWNLYFNLKFFKSTSLRRLRLVGCNLTAYHVSRLLENCPNVTHIDISHNTIDPIEANSLKRSFPVLVEVICRTPRLFDYSDDEQGTSRQ